MSRTMRPVTIGEKFGRLTAELLIGSVNRKRVFQCKCECGNVVKVPGVNLRSGNTSSCGCLNKEIIKKLNRLQIGESSYNYLENRYRQNAKNRKISYDLSYKEFRHLVSQNCCYCGEPPKPWNPHYTNDGIRSETFKNSSEEWASQQWIYINGIDRVNNSDGYKIYNCVSCCSNCNDMKCDKSKQDFLLHIRKISDFTSK